MPHPRHLGEGFQSTMDFQLRRGQVVQVILNGDPLNLVLCSVIWVGNPGSKQEGEAGLERRLELLWSGEEPA